MEQQAIYFAPAARNGSLQQYHTNIIEGDNEYLNGYQNNEMGQDIIDYEKTAKMR